MGELQVSQVDYVPSPGGYEVRGGAPETLRGAQPPAEADYEELVKRFKEGNETYQVRRSPSGTKHETILFNAGQAGKALIFKPSTSFSSGYKNPGNVLETALAATLNPGAAYLYWGSFGNHPTGRMTPADRAYIRKTGRYTTGNGSEESPYEAIDSIKDVTEMLLEHDLPPTHFIADQEAGRLALGIMAAMERDSVRGTYLNGLDGISPGASYVHAPFTEDMKSRVRRHQIGEGKPGELTPVNIEDLKGNMRRIYSGLGRIAHIAPLPVILFPCDDIDKVNLMLGYRKHADLDDLPGHAVFQDMSAALQRQKAMIVMQFNRESSQHNLEDCIEFGRLAMDHIPTGLRSPERGVRLLMGDGTWTQNTDTPYDSTRLQRLGLPDIRHNMVLLGGGRASDSQILALPALRETG